MLLLQILFVLTYLRVNIEDNFESRIKLSNKEITNLLIIMKHVILVNLIIVI